MTQVETRHAFRLYFNELRASLRREGGDVNRAYEWSRYLEHLIECGEIPAEAINWKLR
jgi:hypothetical protein